MVQNGEFLLHSLHDESGSLPTPVHTYRNAPQRAHFVKGGLGSPPARNFQTTSKHHGYSVSKHVLYCTYLTPTNPYPIYTEMRTDPTAKESKPTFDFSPQRLPDREYAYPPYLALDSGRYRDDVLRIKTVTLYRQTKSIVKPQRDAKT
ncbi:hypothetical protein CIB48_g5917 [Xylaria polymorpha]|nr:hypothetical protein CIB48_g5917 [Xylaria polymorpha]